MRQWVSGLVISPTHVDTTLKDSNGEAQKIFQKTRPKTKEGTSRWGDPPLSVPRIPTHLQTPRLRASSVTTRIQ